MKKILLSFLALIALPLVMVAQDELPFTDSVTQVSLAFPKGSKIKTFSSFKKAEVQLKRSFLMVYSMKSTDGKQFTWKKLNEFDDNARYGTLLRSERIDDSLDAWVRYYSTPNGKTNSVTAITLVRGNDYAFYMAETAANESLLSTTAILQTAQFPQSVAPKKETKLHAWVKWGVFLFLLFFAVIAFPLLKKMSTAGFVVVAVLETLALVAWCVFFLQMGWSSLWLVLVAAGEYTVVGVTDSWKDAFNEIWKAISNGL